MSNVYLACVVFTLIGVVLWAEVDTMNMRNKYMRRIYDMEVAIGYIDPSIVSFRQWLLEHR